MYIIQLLLRIHTNDLFLLSPHWFSTKGSPQTNLTTNSCFLFSGVDPPIAEF